MQICRRDSIPRCSVGTMRLATLPWTSILPTVDHYFGGFFVTHPTIETFISFETVTNAQRSSPIKPKPCFTRTPGETIHGLRRGSKDERLENENRRPWCHWVKRNVSLRSDAERRDVGVRHPGGTLSTGSSIRQFLRFLKKNTEIGAVRASEWHLFQLFFHKKTWGSYSIRHFFQLFFH